VFPFTWAVLATLAWGVAGWRAAVVVILLAPLSGFAALRLTETADRALGAFRALGLWIGGRRRLRQLQVERRRLREDIVRIAGELGV
jgi:hypothetical protein